VGRGRRGGGEKFIGGGWGEFYLTIKSFVLGAVQLHASATLSNSILIYCFYFSTPKN
jgi:hypothetical protein